MNTKIIQKQIELLVESRNRLAQSKEAFERALGKERSIPDAMHDLLQDIDDRIECLWIDLADAGGSVTAD